jgi:hypothetical protein
MDAISGVPLNPGELNPLLLWLVRQEMHLFRFKKDFYDAEYPEHAKDLAESDFWQIARNSMVRRLTVPPESDGEVEW